MRGAAHPLTENFSVFGYHVTGSTGTLFLSGIVVGAVAMLGLSVLLAGAGAPRAAGETPDTNSQRSQRETAFLNQERDQRLEHQQADTATGAAVNPQRATTRRNRIPLLGRFSRGRQPNHAAPDAGRHRTRLMRQPHSRACDHRNEGIRNEHR